MSLLKRYIFQFIIILLKIKVSLFSQASCDENGWNMKIVGPIGSKKKVKFSSPISQSQQFVSNEPSGYVGLAPMPKRSVLKYPKEPSTADNNNTMPVSGRKRRSCDSIDVGPALVGPLNAPKRRLFQEPIPEKGPDHTEDKPLVGEKPKPSFESVDMSTGFSKVS